MGGEARQRESVRNEIGAPAATFERDQKLQTLGMLACGIAHDFNNLLVVILGNAGLALLDLESDARARPQVEEIKRAATRAAELTEQVLAYSGRGSSPLEVIDCNALIEEMSCLLRVSIAKTTELELQLADNLPHIEADPCQLRQVLMNLILNAAQALPDQRGTIHIESSASNKRVVLAVRDNGVGMDATTLAKIFDPYFTTRKGGSGLGLAAVKRIIDRHGAKIAVKSTPGKGSNFVLSFASTDKTMAQIEPSCDDLSDYRGHGEILVIDDEPGVRRMVEQSLQRFGFRVHAEADPRVTLNFCRQAGNDLRMVILDLSMPEKTGEETLRALRREMPDLPVLLSSGLGEGSVQNIEGVVFNGFLAKPYTPEQLLAAVRRVLPEG